jgi:2-desacetyl-2-hydroxyethyl bacteriochlorophyllide A dehydrogenase
VRTLKAITLKDIESVETTELADPIVESNTDAIVRVAMAGLCGSDLHPFFGRETGLDPNTVMGHEMVGEVVDVGSEVSAFAVGDRVYVPFSSNCGRCFYCQNELPSRCEVGQLFGWVENGVGLHGCQSEFVSVPFADATLMKVPESVSDEAALLLGDNFSTGFYCAQMADCGPGKVHVVIGCGTVGQLCCVAARSMGAETIIAIDPLESRRKQAEALGARAISPEAADKEIKLLSGGRGADCVMELVGLPDAQRLAYQIVRPGGIMSVIGCHCTPDFQFGPSAAYDKNLTYRTGRCPARHFMDLLTPRVAEGQFDLSGFVTHEFGVEESVKAYDVFSKRLDGCGKAVIRF